MLTDYIPTADDVEGALFRIGEDLYEDTNDETFYPSLITNGHCMVVTFLDLELWNSENIYRDCNEDALCEDLEKFLRRKIMNRIRVLNNVDLHKVRLE